MLLFYSPIYLRCIFIQLSLNDCIKKIIRMDKHSMNLTCFNILLFLIVCQITAGTDFVRISNDFEQVQRKIDTITIISDVMVASGKSGYYDATASYIMNSRITFGVADLLSDKGYNVKITKPCIMGTLNDSTRIAPLCEFKNEKVNPRLFPYYFSTELYPNDLKVLTRLNKKIFNEVIYDTLNGFDSTDIDSSTLKDLKRLSQIINNDYVLFIHHQAGYRVSSNSFGTALSRMILLPLLGPAKAAGHGARYDDVFNTCSILLEITTGKILWSNFSTEKFVPLHWIQRASDKYCKDIFFNFTSDFWVNKNIENWYEDNYEYFPGKQDTDYFRGNIENQQYPFTAFFIPASFSEFSGLPKSRLVFRIDSLVQSFSFLDTAPEWEDRDTTLYDTSHGRSEKSISAELQKLDSYLQFAFNCRKVYKPELYGKITLSFVIERDGSVKKVSLTNSTLDDKVLEYLFPYIVNRLKFHSAIGTIGAAGATLINHEILFN